MDSAPRTDALIALPDGRSLAYAEFGEPDNGVINRALER